MIKIVKTRPLWGPLNTLHIHSKSNKDRLHQEQPKGHSPPHQPMTTQDHQVSNKNVKLPTYIAISNSRWFPC